MESTDSTNKSIIIKTSDICAKGRHPEDILSNWCSNDFCFEGIQCSSMESFLQSLKYEDTELQAKVCLEDARWLNKYDTDDWQKNQILYWKGNAIRRNSRAYKRLIYGAYEAMYIWCARFRDCLMSTTGKKLLFDSGKNDMERCVLTDKEFLFILRKLRKRKWLEYKSVSYPRMWPNSYGVDEDYV